MKQRSSAKCASFSHEHLRNNQRHLLSDTLDMTGPGPPPPRPITPPDPTLVTHPIPHKKAFPIRSFGPGAALHVDVDTDTVAGPDPWSLKNRKVWWDNFKRAAGPEEYDGNSDVLRQIEGSEATIWRENGVIFPQLTWGFYSFLKDYDQTTRESAPRAMENWVRLIQEMQGANANPPNPYADEVCRRFRMDLVEDQETLTSASTDRVRECFRSLTRSLEIADDDDDDDDDDDGEDAWVPPTRNQLCFVLNADKVQMLANLTFPKDANFRHCYRTYEECRVRAVDIRWKRSEASVSECYRGVMDFEICSLARAYTTCENGLDEYSD